MTTPTDDNVIPLKTPVLTRPHPPVNITFTRPDGGVVGVFEFNEQTGKWMFEGDMEESAEKFIHFLTEVINPPGAS